MKKMYLVFWHYDDKDEIIRTPVDVYVSALDGADSTHDKIIGNFHKKVGYMDYIVITNICQL